jgi:tripartite-type tricarboxylate transporter receptor subunit TctC
VRSIFGLILFIGFIAPLHAQNNLQIVVPFAAGGLNDRLARLLALQIPNVIVENITGAGGLVGANAVAKTNKLENMVVLHSDAIMIAPMLATEKFYTFPQDFSCIAEIGETYLVLYKSKKANFPPKNNEILTIADGGFGSTANLASTLLKQYVNVTHINYRGAAPALVGFLAGDTNFLMEFAPIGKEHVNRGTIDVVAVTSLKRQSDFPTAPTFHELGYKNVVVTPTIFVFGNTKMSVQRKLELNQKLNQIMASNTMTAQLEQISVKHTSYDLEQCQNAVSRIHSRWQNVLNAVK